MPPDHPIAPADVTSPEVALATAVIDAATPAPPPDRSSFIIPTPSRELMITAQQILFGRGAVWCTGEREYCLPDFNSIDREDGSDLWERTPIAESGIILEYCVPAGRWEMTFNTVARLRRDHPTAITQAYVPATLLRLDVVLTDLLNQRGLEVYAGVLPPLPPPAPAPAPVAEVLPAPVRRRCIIQIRTEAQSHAVQDYLRANVDSFFRSIYLDNAAHYQIPRMSNGETAPEGVGIYLNNETGLNYLSYSDHRDMRTGPWFTENGWPLLPTSAEDTTEQLIARLDRYLRTGDTCDMEFFSRTATVTPVAMNGGADIIIVDPDAIAGGYNPRQVTNRTVGEGYRILDLDSLEDLPYGAQYWAVGGRQWRSSSSVGEDVSSNGDTYRIPDARVRFIALAPGTPLTDAQIYAKVDTSLANLIRNAPTNPVTRGTIRAQLRIVIPATATTTEAILDILRTQLTAALTPPPLRAVNNDALLTVHITYNENITERVRQMVLRSGSDTIRLSRETLQELAEDGRNNGDDFDDFVSRVREYIEEEVNNNPPDTSAYDTQHEETESSDVESSDVSIDSPLSSRLHALIADYPELNPEQPEDEDEDED